MMNHPYQSQSLRATDWNRRTRVQESAAPAAGFFRRSFELRSFYLTCLLLMLSVVSFAQTRTVTGKVTGQEDGGALPGVNVLVKGTTSGAITDASGSYSISIPGNDATLIFSFIGFISQEVAIGNRTSIDVAMASDVQALEEVVVTGYGTERKKDIIGSVAVVSPKELLQTPAANLQAQLQGRAAGVTVSGTGQPGAGAKVRIRGFSTFGNNDPLYVIDGVPTENPGILNPQDIESLQILKDATSASIYGARAANGVVIVTTRQGKAGAPRISIDSYYGVQTIPQSRYPDLLNAEEYGQYLWRAAEGATPAGQSTVYNNRIYGTGSQPALPDYIVVDEKSSPQFKGGVAADDPRLDPSLYDISNAASIYQILEVPRGGTDWFGAITRPAPIQSHQISASGGSDRTTYALGLNYFNQQGTFINTGYKRYTVRANTMFSPKKWVSVGENLQVSYESRQGNDNRGEGGAWAQAYRMVPYIPVYDVNGGFGGNGVGDSGNGSSPVANLVRDKDDKDFGYQIFGNVFGEITPLKFLSLRTSFGVDYGNRYEQDFTFTTYERTEDQKNNIYEERFGYDLSWTWTNTLTMQHTFANLHAVKVLLGSEAISQDGRRLLARVINLDLNTPIFRSIDRGDPGQIVATNDVATPQDNHTYRSSLSSMFARADYTFNDRYLFNATIRRDGSSRFGPNFRYGVFPSVGVGWRISQEFFMQSLRWLSDLKLRAGWGQMGSQRNVNPYNQYDLYESDAQRSFYDINGANTSAVAGYRRRRLGNPNTKWETRETVNIGLDGTVLNGALDFSVEWYNSETKDLIATRQRAGTEPEADQPQINIGSMRNRGVDITLGTRGEFLTNFTYGATATFSHYKNTTLKLNDNGTPRFEGASRTPNVAITEVGRPISQFYGYVIDGFFQNDEEVTSGPAMPYKRVGSWRIKDLDGDNAITDKDRTYLGSPIPKFQLGMNLSLGWKNFDFSTFLFWNYGNKLYNYTKWFTHLRGFVGGVHKDALYDSWTPDNRDASLPILNSNDTYSGTISSSFFVEPGSFLRARTMQLGYTLPTALTSKLKIQNLRIYVQGQNLFTITKYTGADPDINIQGDSNPTSNAYELRLGVDQAGFPNTKQYILGLNLGF